MSINSITRKDLRRHIFLIIFGGIIGLVLALGFSLLYFFPRYYIESMDKIVNGSTLFMLIIISFLRQCLNGTKKISYDDSNGVCVDRRIFKWPISFGWSSVILIILIIFSILNAIN